MMENNIGDYSCDDNQCSHNVSETSDSGSFEDAWDTSPADTDNPFKELLRQLELLQARLEEVNVPGCNGISTLRSTNNGDIRSLEDVLQANCLPDRKKALTKSRTPQSSMRDDEHVAKFDDDEIHIEEEWDEDQPGFGQGEEFPKVIECDAASTGSSISGELGSTEHSDRDDPKEDRMTIILSHNSGCGIDNF